MLPSKFVLFFTSYLMSGLALLAHRLSYKLATRSHLREQEAHGWPQWGPSGQGWCRHFARPSLVVSIFKVAAPFWNRHDGAVITGMHSVHGALDPTYRFGVLIARGLRYYNNRMTKSQGQCNLRRMPSSSFLPDSCKGGDVTEKLCLMISCQNDYINNRLDNFSSPRTFPSPPHIESPSNYMATTYYLLVFVCVQEKLISDFKLCLYAIARCLAWFNPLLLQSGQISME